MKIKRDPADDAFSEYIRRRDQYCQRCGSPGRGPKRIIGLEISHYFGRGQESVRFDPENCDALCFGCHQYWGSTNRESYREFKINQLGQERYQALVVRANTFKKRDRKMELIIAKELLKTLE